MLFWIVVGIMIYLAIGIALLIWAVTSDPWGGLILHFAVPAVLLWPYFVVREIINKFK